MNSTASSPRLLSQLLTLFSVALSHLPSPVSGSALPGTSSTNSSSIVTLADYGSFRGTTINTSLTGYALPAPVSAWVGIPYAHPSRYEVAAEPAPFEGVRAADEFGVACVQVDGNGKYAEGEDCLTFNVFRPANASGGGDGGGEKGLLPVLAWIHGGGFVGGSARSFDAPAFVAKSPVPVMVVTFQYRLNSLGFLPSPSLAAEGLLNLGLRDQRQFLLFLQKHVSSFGGDPSRVTVGGRSAGAHSTGFHYVNVLPGNASVMSQAIMQSGGPTARTFPALNYTLYTGQYAEFLQRLGCDGVGGSGGDVECLKQLDVGVIQNVSQAIWDENSYWITWPFQPVQGGFMLEEPGSKHWADGNFNHVPVLTSSTTDEGRFYSPTDINTTSETLSFLHNLYRDLTAAQLTALGALYPSPSAPSSPYANQTYNDTVSRQYTRLSAAITDSMYVCCSQETATRVSDAGVPVWKLHWDVADAADYEPYQGVPHTSDTLYTWDDDSRELPERAHALAAYYASFVASGDPNAHSYQGAPVWETYDDGQRRQLRVSPGWVGLEKDEKRREQCEFWRSIPQFMHN